MMLEIAPSEYVLYSRTLSPLRLQTDQSDWNVIVSWGWSVTLTISIIWGILSEWEFYNKRWHAQREEWKLFSKQGELSLRMKIPGEISMPPAGTIPEIAWRSLDWYDHADTHSKCSRKETKWHSEGFAQTAFGSRGRGLGGELIPRARVWFCGTSEERCWLLWALAPGGALASSVLSFSVDSRLLSLAV